MGITNQTVVNAAKYFTDMIDLLGATQVKDSLEGAVFYVEANTGSDDNDGSDWGHAFKTLPYALKVSQAEISNSAFGYGRGWGSRNKVYCKGVFTETLVKLADKTDIIGVGEVQTRARITGTHVPVANTFSTRIINFELRNNSADVMWTFDAGGFQFINCDFRVDSSSTISTYALVIENPTDVLIQGCRFIPLLTTPFSTAAISLDHDEAINNCRIIGNRIEGAVGVTIAIDGTHGWFGCSMRDNFIKAATYCIDDHTQQFCVIDNRMITDATWNNGISYNEKKGAGNILTSSEGSRNEPDLLND